MRKKAGFLSMTILLSAGIIACGNTGDKSQDLKDKSSIVNIETSTEGDSTAEQGTTESIPGVGDKYEIVQIGKGPGSGSNQGGAGVTPGITPGVTEAPTPTPTPGGGTVVANGKFESSDYSITINGIKLAVGDNFTPNIEKVGSNPEIVEGQACLDGGYDTNYFYGDELAVYTYAQDGKQIIYDIYITSSDYPTAKGATVGVTTKEDVYKMYGTPMKSLPSADRYYLSGNDNMLIFSYSSGVVESIDIVNTGMN